MQDPLFRFHRLRLETNPFEVVEPGGAPELVDASAAGIAAYYRARVDRVSLGPEGRFPLTAEALHRLENLGESNAYRVERILYQTFEWLVRDERVEEKAIERGYGSFLLEEQESAGVRGRAAVLK